MLSLLLGCVVITVILFSKGFARWAWYGGITDPQTKLTPNLSNLGWYICKYDYLGNKIERSIKISHP